MRGYHRLPRRISLCAELGSRCACHCKLLSCESCPSLCHHAVKEAVDAERPLEELHLHTGQRLDRWVGSGCWWWVGGWVGGWTGSQGGWVGGRLGSDCCGERVRAVMLPCAQQPSFHVVLPLQLFTGCDRSLTAASRLSYRRVHAAESVHC